MGLPKAIEEMEAEGMRKWNEMYGDKKDEKTLEPGAPDPEKKPDAEPEKKPDAEPEKKPEPEPKPEPKPEEKIQHQFDVLKGKYDAEVPRLAFELAESKKKEIDLQKALDEAKKPKEEPKPPEGEEKIKTFQKEYPEIYEGASFLMKQLITEELSKAKGDFSKDISDIKKDVKEVRDETGKSQKQLFLDSLDRDPEVGKEWRTINQDENFIGWLQSRAPYSGKKMHDLLMDSWNGMNTEATLEFFKDYKNIKKEVVTEPKPKDKKPKIEDKDLHPPKGGGSEIDTKGKDEGEIVTPDQLLKFADEVQRGKWKGRDKERDAEEKRLTEGVIRWKQKSLKT